MYTARASNGMICFNSHKNLILAWEWRKLGPFLCFDGWFGKDLLEFIRDRMHSAANKTLLCGAMAEMLAIDMNICHFLLKKHCTQCRPWIQRFQGASLLIASKMMDDPGAAVVSMPILLEPEELRLRGGKRGGGGGKHKFRGSNQGCKKKAK
jgi:hypothetical protein